VELQKLEAGTVRAGPQVHSQEVPLGAAKLSVQVPRDEAFGLVARRAPEQPFQGPLLMPGQEAHA